MTVAAPPDNDRKATGFQQAKAFPLASLPQFVGGRGWRGVNMLPFVALIGPLFGTEPVLCGEGAGAGDPEEKMLTLPARTPVGWVASPAIEGGCSGAGGKPAAGATSGPVCWPAGARA
jgi:hypothetical protein